MSHCLNAMESKQFFLELEAFLISSKKARKAFWKFPASSPQFNPYINVTETFSTGESIAITLEVIKSLMKNTFIITNLIFNL